MCIPYDLSNIQNQLAGYAKFRIHTLGMSRNTCNIIISWNNTKLCKHVYRVSIQVRASSLNEHTLYKYILVLCLWSVLLTLWYPTDSMISCNMNKLITTTHWNRWALDLESMWAGNGKERMNSGVLRTGTASGSTILHSALTCHISKRMYMLDMKPSP